MLIQKIITNQNNKFMRNMKSLLLAMLMMTSVFFFACNKDDSTDLSPDQAKVELTNVGTDLSTYMTDMQETDGMIVMGTLMSMPDPFATAQKSNVKTDVISNINRFLLPKQPEKLKSSTNIAGFDFSASVGTYTWNNTY